MLILGQKLPISLILRTIKFFLKKSYFYPFSKACNQIKFQKNLEKTLKSVDFRPQNSWLSHFEHKIFFAKKKSLRHFFVFIEPSLRKKEKSNDPIKRKRPCRHTDVWTNGRADGWGWIHRTLWISQGFNWGYSKSARLHNFNNSKFYAHCQLWGNFWQLKAF